MPHARSTPLRGRLAPLACASLLSLAGAFSARAQESPLCLAANDAHSLQVLASGAGTIFVWADQRDTTDHPIRLYAQQTDASGVPLWAADGVQLCIAGGDQLAHVAVTDGSGGAIVVWVDNRALPGPTEIYAQHIDASGTTTWAAAGVLVSTVSARGMQSPPTAVTDGAGGVFVAWETEDPATGVDIQAQHLSAAGAPLWTAAGVEVCGVAGDQILPVMARRLGTVVVAWEDGRAFPAAPDPYAQALSIAGAGLWGAGGVAVTTSGGNETELAIVGDSVGGAILSWRDDRNSIDSDIYAQRLNSGGIALWDGAEPGPDLRICGAVSDQVRPRMVRPVTGRTVIGWSDRRGADWDVYAQAVLDGGVISWTVDGVAASAASGDQWLSSVAPDATSGGALLLWHDDRDEVSVSGIYGQWIVASGALQWPPGGLLLVDQPLAQRRPVGWVTGATEAIVAWEDGRGGADWDLYVLPIELTPVSVPESRSGPITELSVAPNPTRGTAEFAVALARPASIELVLVDLGGRLVRRVFTGRAEAGTTRFEWEGSDHDGRQLPTGLYFLRLTSDRGLPLVRRVVLAH